MQIAPRCFLADVDKRMLVFEDLRNQHFNMANRYHGLDMEHTKLTLSTLAKWHAGTAKLLLTNNELFHWYTKRDVYANAPNVQSFFKNIAKSVANTVKHWHGYEIIADKLTNIPQQEYDNAHKWFLPQPEGFNVITHGDMYMNNILFRHDENGHPTDIRFVDFPLGKHVNPSIDLTCLLYGSTSSTIEQTDFELLIQYYHSELMKNLKLLNFPGRFPTLLEIQIATFRIDIFSALIALFIVGLRYVNQCVDGGFVEVANHDRSNGDDTEKLYSHPACIERLQFLLNIFDRRGYFDF